MAQYRRVNRGRRSEPVMLPAPVGGLNGRDSFAAMPPTDAFVLDNWFPNSTSVDVRGGTLDFATGMPGPVETMAAYTGPGTDKLLAFSSGNVYNVTAGGAVGAAIKSGMSTSRVTTAMFSNAGTQFLLVYSGGDQPFSWDGTTVTALTITGMSGSQNTLHSPHAFKGRVYLCQKDMLGFYYLGVGAIQGAASYFDLSQISMRGGTLATITSFSQAESGQGPNDYILFITTKGEYILYNGTDPSNAATWTLVGRYYSSPPIGKKGWFKFRADVYFITEGGIISFSQIRQTGEGEDTKEYITAKLGRNYSDVTNFKGNQGWCGVVYPKRNMLIVNAPFTGSISGEYVQFAMNTDTNAWGRFRGMSALDWVVFNEQVYFSTYGGKVILYDQGSADNGMQISAIGRQAWNTFANDRVGLVNKQLHMVQVVLKAADVPSIAISVNVNFEDDRPDLIAPIVSGASATWDVSFWNADYWAGTLTVQNLDVLIGKIGYTASLWVEVGVVSSGVQWIASRVLLENTKKALL